MGDSLSTEELRHVRTYATESKEYISQKESLPLLFKKDERNPFFPYIGNSPYSKVAVSVAHAVCGGGKFVGGVGDDLPRDLPAICRREADCEFSMQNDACWASGAIAFLKSEGQNVTFPSLAITLGTNPGVAFCQDEKTITDVELFYVLDQHPFTNLITCSLWQRYFSLFPGKAYFEWKFHGKPFKDEEMEPYLDSFNQLIQAFSQDMVEYTENKFGIAPASLIIRGGNSRFVRVPDHSKLKTYLLNPSYLEGEQVACQEYPLSHLGILIPFFFHRNFYTFSSSFRKGICEPLIDCLLLNSFESVHY